MSKKPINLSLNLEFKTVTGLNLAKKITRTPINFSGKEKCL